MRLLGSIAQLWQFLFDIVIHQSVERYRHGKSVLKVQAQPKSLNDTQGITLGRILRQSADHSGPAAAPAFCSGFVEAKLPDVFRPNSLSSGQTSKLISGSRAHDAPPILLKLWLVFASADDDQSLFLGNPFPVSPSSLRRGRMNLWNSQPAGIWKQVLTGAKANPLHGSAKGHSRGAHLNARG